MFSIENNDITLIRGDTLLLEIQVIRQGEIYTPREGDVIRFAMKRKYSDPDDKVVLVKEIPIETLILELEPQDTKSLPMRSRYVYDIQITDVDGRVDTFMKGTLTIEEEVL